MPKHIMPILGLLLLFSTKLIGQVGGWGTCEFATVATMNAFDPSPSPIACKKAFVQASNEHYRWGGTVWVLEGSGGSGENIYTTSDDLTEDRVMTLDGYDLTIKGATDFFIESTGNVGIGTNSPNAKLDIENGTVRFSDYGTGTNTGVETYVLAVDTDGDIIEVAPSDLGDNLGNHVLEENIQTDDYWISNDGDDEGIFITVDGTIGIGTDTPNAFFDVNGGTVKFSNYGSGTNTGTDTYVLSVDANGDIKEMNTVKSSKIFYPPAMTIDASAIVTSQTIDLHQQYTILYGAPAVKNPSAPTTIPTYLETELHYYIVDYDTSILDNVTIDDNGVVTYDIIAVPTDKCALISMIFVVK